MLLWTPGWGELVVIFLIVLILFGGKKLPSLARSLGSGINEFKKGFSGSLDESDIEASKEKNGKEAKVKSIEEPAPVKAVRKPASVKTSRKSKK